MIATLLAEMERVLHFSYLLGALIADDGERAESMVREQVISDATPEDCGQLRFLRVEGPALEYALKALAAPRGRSELRHPLGLSDKEIG